MAVKRRVESLRLRVDPIMCDGYGHCRELAPELVTLDEWGYPILHSEAFANSKSELVRSAKLAIRGCPRQALWLEHLSERG